MKIKVGDWVRFYQNGQMVIAAVDYIRQHRVLSYRKELCTTAGVVSEDDVLETRSVPSPQE